MYLQEIENVLDSQFVKIKYDCDGQSDRCGKEWFLKLKDAKKNFDKNNGKHLCRQCQLKSNNPMSRKEVQEKVKKTSMERYGISCPMNKSELIEERKQKYKDADFVEKVTSKRKQTSIEKYGVDHPMKTDEVKEKQRQVMQEKYGVDHPLQNTEILEKMKQTNLERYGFENVTQSPEVRIKMAKSTLERYGVEHYNQLPEMREYLQIMCREWLAESWANPWAKGITRPEEWNQKARETIAELVSKGEWHGGDTNSMKGRYFSEKCYSSNNPIFRSSFELKVHIWLDNNIEVEGYDYEPFVIEYEDTEGKKRYYFPDFIIYFKSKKTFLLEVKNDFSVKAKINENKHQAATKYANNNQFDYYRWTNNDIKNLNVNLDDYKDKFKEF